jgi:hypothetical protein
MCQFKGMRVLSLIICTGLIFLSCSGQQKKTKKKDLVLTESNYSKDIDEYVENIKNQNLDSILCDIYKSTEGGEISHYYKASDTLKTKVIFYGETGKREIVAYLKKAQLLYVVDIVSYYNVPIDINTDMKVISKTQDEYYFNENRELIKHLKNDTIVQLKTNTDLLATTLSSLLKCD